MWETIKRAFWWVPFGQAPELTARELHTALQSGTPPQLLDVRSHLEWRNSHIAGAENVPLGELKRRLGGLALDGERPVVAICLSAHRSIPAVRLLRSTGLQEVKQLQGGMLAWWRAGLPTES